MKRKNVRIIALLLFLFLGLTLGGSLTTFFFFLNTHIDSLIIFSYLCILIFIIFLILEMVVLYRYRNILFKKGVDNYEKQD
ncbi:MAG: hypothetical protein J5880_01540 [Bacilli bacterium]|nr:hypothetical protein [Bacilli bacterium]MBO4682241.1 hypothetical protein [Bacilli bacterium]